MVMVKLVKLFAVAVLCYRRNIMLLKEMDTVGKPVTGQVKSRGNMMYRVEKGLGPMPVLMMDLTNQVSKVSLVK